MTNSNTRRPYDDWIQLNWHDGIVTGLCEDFRGSGPCYIDLMTSDFDKDEELVNHLYLVVAVSKSIFGKFKRMNSVWVIRKHRDGKIDFSSRTWKKDFPNWPFETPEEKSEWDELYESVIEVVASVGYLLYLPRESLLLGTDDYMDGKFKEFKINDAILGEILEGFMEPHSINQHSYEWLPLLKERITG